ncbi:MAG: ADP-ribosylglycohydrolase family protein, partial [Chloroflexota bacterium]
HDGEAVYGAQVIAAMEAQAFIEKDINTLIDTAVALIPEQSTIYHMIEQIREWHATEPDWRKAREQLDANFGNHIYGGNCHMVPNHGLIIFSLLYGDDDFQKSLMVVNTSGWDTDCNSGNLGCLLGIKNGLAGIDAGPDWRGPIADRVYLPTADGGRAITDAVTETMHVVNIGRALAGKDAIAPKNGARFHFELPGSVQGFQVDQTVDSRDTATIENVPAYSQKGKRTLAIRYRRLATGRVARVTTPTFIPSKAIQNYFERRGYELLASPTLYTGQTLYATVTAGQDNVGPVDIRFIVQHYNETDELTPLASDPSTLSAGSDVQVIWQIPDTGGYPIASVGLEVSGNNGQSGTIYLDYLTWDGAPNIVLDRPYERTHTRLGRGDGPTMWKAAWVDGLDSGERLSGLDFWPEPYRLIQNQGRGLLMHGTRDWTDYEISARMTPHMCKAGGIAVRVQGMHRYYALLCDSEKTRLIRSLERQDTVLAEVDGGWTLGVSCELSLSVEGNKLVGSMNGEKIAEAIDSTSTLMGGGIALMAEEGRIGCDHVAVKPINQNGSMSR